MKVQITNERRYDSGEPYMFASGWVSDCRHSVSCGRKKVLPDSLFSYPTEPKKELQLDDFRFIFFFSTFQKLCRPVPIYFVRILSCLNCSSFWSRKMNWFSIVFYFSFCFTSIFRVSHITVSSWRFDLNVWFQSLPNVFPVFFSHRKFWILPRITLLCRFILFPVSRWFSFWKISDSHWFSLFLARFRQAKLINLVPFHPEEPKSYTFKFYKFFSLYIFFFFL